MLQRKPYSKPRQLKWREERTQGRAIANLLRAEALRIQPAPLQQMVIAVYLLTHIRVAQLVLHLHRHITVRVEALHHTLKLDQAAIAIDKTLPVVAFVRGLCQEARQIHGFELFPIHDRGKNDIRVFHNLDTNGYTVPCDDRLPVVEDLAQPDVEA